jgi:serine/threonine protein kinase
MPLAPGTQLGPYEITAALGAGGMGEVYRARDTRLERTVAIKILPSPFSADTVRKQRFEREAKAISQLNHPHICILHDIGSQDGIEYLVMECVEGETLAKRLEKGPLPLEQVLKYGAQIADALDKAHRAGIVHRDLKPGNIMLTPDGAKLLDFGLAKPAVATNLATMTATRVEAPVTQEGTVVGTFQYMSPEQVEGKEVDGRSDIFSLGAVLYEMLTGKRAFEGKSQLSVASAILEREPAPIHGLKPLTPASFAHVVERCLAKNPDDRWQAARDVASELTWVAQGAGTSQATAVTPRSQKKIVWGLTVTCFSLLFWLGWTQVRTPVVPHQKLRLSLLPPAGKSFSPRNVSISPDGQKIAFLAEGEGANKLWIRSLSSGSAQELNNTEGAIYPFWSGDSRQVGFFAAGKLKTIEPGSGAIQIVCDAPPLFGATWNDHGVIVFSSSLNGSLLQVAASGGVPKPATKPGGDDSYRWPFFLPDGEHFLYSSANQKSADKLAGAIYVGSLSSLEGKLISTEISNNVQYGNGKLFFEKNRNLMAQPFDANRLEFSGSPELISPQELELGVAFFQAGFSVSANGIVVFQSNSDNISRLTWFDRLGRELGVIPAVGFRDPFLSRDGSLLAATSDDQLNGRYSARLYDLIRGTSTVVSSSGSDQFPVLSPDNKTLAFDRGLAPSGGVQGSIFIVPADNSGKPEVLVRGPVVSNDWSKDGRYLLFMDFRGGGGYPALGYYDFEKRSENSYGLGGAEAQVSPDGKWIAFTGAAGESNTPDYQDSEIYIGPFPVSGGRKQVSNHGGAQPRWNPNGKELYYITEDKKLMAVPISIQDGRLEAGIPKMLFQTRIVASRYAVFQYAVSSDGKRFLINSHPSGWSSTSDRSCRLG